MRCILHRAAGHTPAAERLRLARESATAVMAHTGDNGAQGPVPPPAGMGLVDHLDLAAAVALDAQEPRREGGERPVEGLGAGRERPRASGLKPLQHSLDALVGH
jgi:hypothetical protein